MEDFRRLKANKIWNRKTFKKLFKFGNLRIYCANDECYEARFVTEDGTKFEYKMSRAKVMEHVEKHSAHPDKYLTNKGLVVTHFHAMAIAWYKLTHLPKNMILNNI